LEWVCHNTYSVWAAFEPRLQCMHPNSGHPMTYADQWKFNPILFCKHSLLITGLCFTFKQLYTDQIWWLSGHIGLPGSRRFPSLKTSHIKKMHVTYYPLHFIWWPSGWSGGNRACGGIVDCSQVSWANPNVSPLPTHKGEE
jgi:hypothetical protein